MTRRVPTSIANTMHEHTGNPSTNTVHAEHAPRLQAIFVPLSNSGPRSASANSLSSKASKSRSGAIVGSTFLIENDPRIAWW